MSLLFFSQIVFNRNPFLQLREGVRKEIGNFLGTFPKPVTPPPERLGTFFLKFCQKSRFLRTKTHILGSLGTLDPPPYLGKVPKKTNFLPLLPTDWSMYVISESFPTILRQTKFLLRGDGDTPNFPRKNLL